MKSDRRFVVDMPANAFVVRALGGFLVACLVFVIYTGVLISNLAAEIHDHVYSVPVCTKEK